MTRLSLIVCALMLGTAADAYRRVCYHTNWSQYRNGPAKFYPENIDPSLCTHIIYAFAKMNGNHLAAFEWNDESTPWMKGMYERFNAVKQSNPSVKVMLAVGGWNMASAPFTRMVSSDANIQDFATTAVQFLRKNNFEGLDIDWEYPANRGSPAGDKQRYVKLLQTLRATFDSEAVPAGKERLMLSAAVPAGKDKIDSGFDVPAVAKLLDMINLMTYDLHGSWEDHTGHHSGLYARAADTGNDTYLNTDWAAQYWVQKGAPRSKMNIGMALYGRSFALPWGATDSAVGCPAKGAGAAGQYTSEAGFIAYYEICPHLAKSSTTKTFDTEAKVPYFADGSLWVGYEDPDSLKIKVDYVKQEQFGGIMVWALDLDDFSGSCGQGKYPLLRSIVTELNANPVVTNAPVTQPPITQAPITNAPITNAPITNAPITNAPVIGVTTRAPVVTQAPVTQAPTAAPSGHTGSHHDLTFVSHNEFDCSARSDGYYASPTSCSNYYVCAAKMTFRTDCHPGLMFNEQTLYCDFPDHVTCNAMQPVVNTQAPYVPVNTQAPYVPVNTPAPATFAPQPAYTNPPVVATNPPTQPPQQQITNAPVVGPQHHEDFCKGKTDGFYADPTDCAHFYQCSFSVSYYEPCPSGTYFSIALQGCDWPGNVPNCP